jgi:hypothetical protein
MKNAYKVLVGKFEENRELGIPMRNIKLDLKQTR